MIIKIFYTIFIGILLALFVGVGTAAFYNEPQYPDYPASLKYAQEPPYDSSSPRKATSSTELQIEQEKYDKVTKTYEEKRKVYQRNVSIITLIASVISS